MYILIVKIFPLVLDMQGFSGYVVFVWVYGAFSGGYHYTLKMYLFEKVSWARSVADP